MDSGWQTYSIICSKNVSFLFLPKYVYRIFKKERNASKGSRIKICDQIVKFVRERSSFGPRLVFLNFFVDTWTGEVVLDNHLTSVWCRLYGLRGFWLVRSHHLPQLNHIQRSSLLCHLFLVRIKWGLQENTGAQNSPHWRLLQEQLTV